MSTLRCLHGLDAGSCHLCRRVAGQDAPAPVHTIALRPRRILHFWLLSAAATICLVGGDLRAGTWPTLLAAPAALYVWLTMVVALRRWLLNLRPRRAPQVTVYNEIPYSDPHS